MECLVKAFSCHLEEELTRVDPSGETETIYFRIGKGEYEPTPEELEKMREYDLAHPGEDKTGPAICRYRIMPFKQYGRDTIAAIPFEVATPTPKLDNERLS